MDNATSTYEIMRNKRRSQILDTAKRMILENGIDSLNMQKLAQKMQISRVTLYKYYKSIEEIVVEIEKALVSTTFCINRNLSMNIDSSEELSDFLRLFIRFAFEHADDYTFNCLFDIYIKTKAVSPKLHDLYEQFVKDIDNLPNIIAQLQTKLLIRTDIDAECLAYFINYVLLGALERYIILKETPNRYVPIDDNLFADSLVQMITAFLKA